MLGNRDTFSSYSLITYDIRISVGYWFSLFGVSVAQLCFSCLCLSQLIGHFVRDGNDEKIKHLEAFPAQQTISPTKCSFVLNAG